MNEMTVEWTIRIPSWANPLWEELSRFYKVDVSNNKSEVYGETKTAAHTVVSIATVDSSWKEAIAWIIKLGIPNVISAFTKNENKTKEEMLDIRLMVGGLFDRLERLTGPLNMPVKILDGKAEKWMSINSIIPLNSIQFNGWEREEAVRELGVLVCRSIKPKKNFGNYEERSTPYETSSSVSLSEIDLSFAFKNLIEEGSFDKVFSLGDSIGGSILQWLRAHGTGGGSELRLAEVLQKYIGLGGDINIRNKVNLNNIFHSYAFWSGSEKEADEVVASALKTNGNLLELNARGRTAIDMARLSTSFIKDVSQYKGMVFWSESGSFEKWRDKAENMILISSNGLKDKIRKKQRGTI
jgi:hypothetical protein